MTAQLEIIKRENIDYEYFDLVLRETYTKYDGMNEYSDNNKINLLFTEELTSQEVIDINALHNNLLPENLIETKFLKIYRYVADQTNIDKTIPPKCLDYKTGLTTNLYPKRHFVKGELQHVDWFADQECTDLVICIKMEYVRDALGFAQSRTTTRRWVREDGTEHPDAKITHKDYTLNPMDMTAEGKRRRGNNIDNSILVVLQFMQLTIPVTHPEKTAKDILLDGRAFQTSLEPYIMTYKNSSNNDIITQINDATDYWLDNDISTITGVADQTIRTWMIEELSIWT